MKKSFALRAAALAVALAAGSAAQAAPVQVALASNAYITVGGLDWAWASALGQSDVDLSFQSQFGWRLPTVAELAVAPSAVQFLFVGGNAVGATPDPVSGSFWAFTDNSNFGRVGQGACASGYFSISLKNCDYGNAPGSQGANVVPWAGQAGSSFFSESLVVRTAAATELPEPSALALVGLALAGAAMVRRRKA